MISKLVRIIITRWIVALITKKGMILKQAELGRFQKLSFESVKLENLKHCSLRPWLQLVRKLNISLFYPEGSCPQAHRLLAASESAKAFPRHLRNLSVISFPILCSKANIQLHLTLTQTQSFLPKSNIISFI